MKFDKHLTLSVCHCYFAVEPCVAFTYHQLPSATKKVVLPALQHNNTIYQYLCNCDSQYAGSTSQRSSERIK